MNTLKRQLAALMAAGLMGLLAMFATAMVFNVVLEGLVRQEGLAKDLVADVLPPPMYLVETRLLVSQAIEHSMTPEDARSTLDRLASEYDARVRHWQQQLPKGLPDDLLVAHLATAQQVLREARGALAAVDSREPEALRRALQSTHAAYLAHRAAVDRTAAASVAFAEQTHQRMQDTQQASMAVSIVIGMVCAVAVAGLGWLVQRRVFASTGGEPAVVARLANAVASGDLTLSVPVRAGDTRSVMAAMARMCENLRQSVSDIRSSGEAIAAGAHQIASGNNDLCQRTEHQAGRVQETASAMEQFSGSVNQTADAARSATQLAQSASAVADRGAQSMRDLAATMGDIAAASTRIAEITSVIDGIAFQTNILALNAAVEAARAGEQGRGFAVVAGEVRTLAQRSAAAAREINALIDASVQRVEQGNQRVKSAGDTMAEILGQVQRVAQFIAEIGAATSEQTKGIGSVSTAMGQLDGVTQQNAALVEQSAAAAGLLKQHADQLVGVVGRYRLAAA